MENESKSNTIPYSDKDINFISIYRSPTKQRNKKDEMNVVSRFLECQLCLLVEGDPSTTEVEKIIAENSNTKRK